MHVYTLIDIGLSEKSLVLFTSDHCKHDDNVLFLVRGVFSYTNSINYTLQHKIIAVSFSVVVLVRLKKKEETVQNQGN